MKYRDVVFLDGDSSDEPFRILDENGLDALFEYLLQWEYGETGEIRDEKPWGLHDSLYITTEGPVTYAVSYNWSLSYVSLTEVIND